MVSAFVLIDAEFDRIADLAAELADVDGVSEVHSVAGDEDLVAVVRVKDHEDVAEVVTRGIGACGGINRTRTLISFRAYSRYELDDMWSIGLPSDG